MNRWIGSSPWVSHETRITGATSKAANRSDGFIHPIITVGQVKPKNSAVRQMLSITQQTFGKDADCTDLVRVVERWAGCEIRGPQQE